MTVADRRRRQQELSDIRGPRVVKYHCTAERNRDLCKTPLFAQFLRQTQILILEILNVFLRLKLSTSLNLNLNLNKNEHFSKVSQSYVSRLPNVTGTIVTRTLNSHRIFYHICLLIERNWDAHGSSE